MFEAVKQVFIGEILRELSVLIKGDFTLLKVTRRMAIANGTCVSFCNQPKAHYLAPSRESRRYVVACSRRPITAGGIWLRQESLRHLFASPGYARGTIAVSVTWIEREFNAGQTHRSIYPSIFNRFRAIARYWSDIATFSYTPLHLTPLLGVFPLEFPENVWTSEN